MEQAKADYEDEHDDEDDLGFTGPRNEEGETRLAQTPLGKA